MRIAFLILLTSACAWAADAKAGQALYARACGSCHGPEGKPSAAVAKMLKVEMRELKTALGSLSDEGIRKIVVDGKGKMAPVKGVSGAELDNLIAHLRTLK